jgi:O-acetyl-ADP-ribose deacetylase
LSNLQMDLPRNKDYVVTLKIGDHGEIRLLRGDITQIPSDAIVNAANSELLPGGGVCGAIHRAGGPQIADECRRIRSERGRLAAGKAVATTAGNLPAKYVIHAVGPVWQGGDQGEAEVLASCYRESVRIADELELHSIALPAISTGIFGYPLEKAAGVAIPTLVDSLRSAKQIRLIMAVLFDKASLDAFAKAALAQRQPDSGAPYNVVIGTNSA